MKKRVYIIGILTLALAFTGCSKCEKPMMSEDPFINATDRSTLSSESPFIVDRDAEESVGGQNQNGTTDGGITDPKKDPDFDGIVDPDKDEDFDKGHKGR